MFAQQARGRLNFEALFLTILSQFGRVVWHSPSCLGDDGFWLPKVANSTSNSFGFLSRRSKDHHVRLPRLNPAPVLHARIAARDRSPLLV